MGSVQEAWAAGASLVLALTGLVVISEPGKPLTVKATPMTVVAIQPASRSAGLVQQWATSPSSN